MHYTWDKNRYLSKAKAYKKANLYRRAGFNAKVITIAPTKDNTYYEVHYAIRSK